MTGALLLADSDAGKSSPIGLLVVLLLVIAVYFLWRSMNRHLKKVQQDSPEPGVPPTMLLDGEQRPRPGATRGEPTAGDAVPIESPADPDRPENPPPTQG